MKSLTSIDEILHNHSEIRDTSAAFFDENTNFPLNIEGLHGSLFTYFTAEVCRSNHLKALQAEQSPVQNLFFRSDYRSSYRN